MDGGLVRSSRGKGKNRGEVRGKGENRVARVDEGFMYVDL